MCLDHVNYRLYGMSENDGSTKVVTETREGWRWLREAREEALAQKGAIARGGARTGDRP